ncbi:hypothetical protein QJS66_13280 [Kocuria rhizophila]|nr:hypothetical protein QJS66_13280 [Kocuria rhizophila]
MVFMQADERGPRSRTPSSREAPRPGPERRRHRPEDPRAQRQATHSRRRARWRRRAAAIRQELVSPRAVRWTRGSTVWILTARTVLVDQSGPAPPTTVRTSTRWLAENRARFVIEVACAVAEEIGGARWVCASPPEHNVQGADRGRPRRRPRHLLRRCSPACGTWAWPTSPRCTEGH